MNHLRPPKGGHWEVTLSCGGQRRAGVLVNGRWMVLRCRDRVCRHSVDRDKRNGEDLTYDAYHWYDLWLGGKLRRHEFKPKGGGDSVFEEVG
jgi:hypothetical protein